jgi:hypothetical protein
VDALVEARREASVEATLFILAAAALLVALAATSYMAGWELLGIHGWVWLALCIPEALLIAALLLSVRMTDHVGAHRVLKLFISVVIVGNLAGLALLIAALLTEKSSDLSGGQLLMSGGVLWLVNVIVFGLAFWMLDCGGRRNGHCGATSSRTSSSRKTKTRSWRVPGGIRGSRITCTSR